MLFKRASTIENVLTGMTLKNHSGILIYSPTQNLCLRERVSDYYLRLNNSSGLLSYLIIIPNFVFIYNSLDIEMCLGLEIV